MKIDSKYIVATIVGLIIGLISGFAVQEYAIQRHKRIKRIEKEALKQKIKRENQILIRRIEEDYKAFKDSVTAVYVRKKKQEEHKLSGPGLSGLKSAIKARLDGEKDRILAKKRKEIDREIEDLEMRLDF
jgi:hypothetical protein